MPSSCGTCLGNSCLRLGPRPARRGGGSPRERAGVQRSCAHTPTASLSSGESMLVFITSCRSFLVTLKLNGISTSSFYLEHDGLLIRWKGQLCWIPAGPGPRTEPPGLQTGRGREDSRIVLQVFGPHGPISGRHCPLRGLGWFKCPSTGGGVCHPLTHIELALTQSHAVTHSHVTPSQLPRWGAQTCH